MKVKKIPVRAAKAFAADFSLRQVVICGWDGERTHTVSYGESETDCQQAAHVINALRRLWGIPEAWPTRAPDSLHLAAARSGIQRVIGSLNDTDESDDLMKVLLEARDSLTILLMQP